MDSILLPHFIYFAMLSPSVCINTNEIAIQKTDIESSTFFNMEAVFDSVEPTARRYSPMSSFGKPIAAGE
jgi:hypothetical protein